MSLKKGDIGRAIKLTGFFIPFTWYFILFAASAWLAYRWLIEKQEVPGSAFNDIFVLLIKVTIWFCAVLVIIAFLSVFISFLIFLWKKRKNMVQFFVETKQEYQLSRQAIRIKLHPVLKPFLGFIRLRLEYDEGQYSNKFSLVEQSRKRLISTTMDGIYNWPLPEIKEYYIENAIIYFEDYFQFFSLVVPLKTKNLFYTQPADKPEKEISVSPRKTIDNETRIDELKKVEGELLTYKSFETNDDVRRIVWKIYAKNKELVVRIPEILDPYASHIYLYASFFSAFNIEGNETVEVPFLNFYKTIAWSVFNQLSKQGFEVRFISDQDISQNNSQDTRQIIKYTISTSNWQKDKELKDYVKTKDASMVVISSLSDPEQVQELADMHGNEMAFVFVKLSDSLKSQHIGDWIQWIFIQQEKDDIASYKTSWSLSLLRPKMLQNEKKLSKILEQYDKPVFS